MAVDYSVEVCNKLREAISAADLHRPTRVGRYDPGRKLAYDVTGIDGKSSAIVHLVVDKFVGGGFAGQVYRVTVSAIEQKDGAVTGLEVGGTYAMKILIPPSGFARLFRNVLYWIGFQGPFQLQVNPTAARSGAMWQKFIRRGAKIKFGAEDAVVNIHATFVDSDLGSCGELSEWVDGRTWQLEVDDRMDLLKLWRRGKAIGDEVGSPEYRAKKQFMAEFVKLLHDMGGHEFARQYEWSTCKSQPNCLKRKDGGGDAAEGLTAVDFRAGLALLPFLPMSPGDCKLIIKGLARGSLVQFDRGSLKKLEAFVEAHGDEFADMREMLEPLKAAEQTYRNSVPDITHNHVRLLYSRRLWSTMLNSAVTGWRVRNFVDAKGEEKLRSCKVSTIAFFLIGVVPFLGKFVRRLWCRADWRKHYGAMLTSWSYFRTALRARTAEKVIVWHRAGRLDAARAEKVAVSPLRFFGHLLLSVIPSAGLHRFLSDRQFRKEKLVYISVRPVRLYFNREFREQWLRDMVSEGENKHMLSDDDAAVILSHLNEPFIQKYLKSLAVHVCTLPVTQIVSVAIAIGYVLTHPEMPWKQSWTIGLGIIAFFQVVPISPGSLVRGFYVLYLVIRERNFKDYNIAVFLGFFKYIGYLAFPIQMTYHYPVLARFMAAHWATEAVHIVPVFGERGALLEHWAFCLFYNWPLTIRRRMGKRAEQRASMKPRYWHIPIVAIVAAGIFVAVDQAYIRIGGSLPSLRQIWWMMVLLPLCCGAFVTLGCSGAVFWKRFVGATICGIAVGSLYAAVFTIAGYGSELALEDVVKRCVFATFVFAVLATIGAILAELKLPDPNLD